MPQTEILRDGGRREAQARLWRATGAAAIAIATILATGALAEAAQRVHFKNGHVLVVESVREQGDVVFLQLIDGSEVGFPKSLIGDVEKGPRIRRPRSSTSSNLSSSQRAIDPRTRAFGQRSLDNGESRFGQDFERLGTQATAKSLRTVGYSKFGAGYRSRKDSGKRGPHIRDLRRQQRGSSWITTGRGSADATFAPSEEAGIIGPPRKANRPSKQEKARR